MADDDKTYLKDLCRIITITGKVQVKGDVTGSVLTFTVGRLGPARKLDNILRILCPFICETDPNRPFSSKT